MLAMSGPVLQSPFPVGLGSDSGPRAVCVEVGAVDVAESAFCGAGHKGQEGVCRAVEP